MIVDLSFCFQSLYLQNDSYLYSCLDHLPKLKYPFLHLSPLFCLLLDQLHNLFHHFIFILSPTSEFWQFSGFCSLPALVLWASSFFFCPIVPAPSSYLLPLVDGSHSISLGAGRFFTGAIYLSCRLYCLPFCGCQCGTPLYPRKSPWQERDRLTLESSLGSFPMALQRPDKSKLRSTASPGHLAAFASKSLRNQFSAAVDSGVKGTYTSFLETSLEGMFCTINFLSSGLIYQLLVRFRGRR